jgi:hypothetical protein
MKGNKMYFWLLIADLASTIIIEIMSEAGLREGDITKEEWEAMSPSFVNRRKAAADRIRQHGKEA